MAKRPHTEHDSEIVSDVSKKLKTSADSSRPSTEDNNVSTTTPDTPGTVDTATEPVLNTKLNTATGTNRKNSADMPLSEVLTLEHAISNLQAVIKVITTSNFDEERMKRVLANAEENNLPPQVLLALNRNKLPLFAKLKTLYQEGKLSLFDQIENYDEATDIEFHDKEIVAGFGRKDLKDSKKQQLYDDLTASKELPPAPEIKNPRLKAQVFVHKSLTNIKGCDTSKESLNSNNERLEFVGDSIINNIMTMIVVNQYPHANEGDLSQLRTRLINNNTLLKWSQAYGFDKKLQYLDDEYLLRGNQKIFADVFEAYVGALIMDDSNNYIVVYDWLKRLAMPVLLDVNDHVSKRINTRETEQLNHNAKVELYSLIGFARLGLKYYTVDQKFEKDFTQFTVEVRVGSGEVLGTGIGKNVKEAGLRAAMNVLEKKDIIEKYSRMRASIPREDSTKPSEADGRDKQEHLQLKKEKRIENKARMAQEYDNRGNKNNQGNDRFQRVYNNDTRPANNGVFKNNTDTRGSRNKDPRENNNERDYRGNDRDEGSSIKSTEVKGLPSRPGAANRGIGSSSYRGGPRRYNNDRF